MPTVGWIQEGDSERYFESLGPARWPTGLGHPITSCPFCSGSFDDTRSLHDHLATEHRGARPILMINGAEPASGWILRERVAPGAVTMLNCTSSRLRREGRDFVCISGDVLEEALSATNDAVLILELANRFDPLAHPILQQYRLEVRIPDAAALDAIEAAFRGRLARADFTLGDVDDFLQEPCCGGPGRDYAEALGAYARGVVLKDDPDQRRTSLPHAKYRDLYEESLKGLNQQERPLAWIVRTVVRLALNDFEIKSGVARSLGLVDGVWAFLAELAGQPPIAQSPEVSMSPNRVAVCPLDNGLSRVVDAWESLFRRPRRTAVSLTAYKSEHVDGCPDVLDREKLNALWGAAMIRDCPGSAPDVLRELANTYPFGAWAQSQLERLGA